MFPKGFLSSFLSNRKGFTSIILLPAVLFGILGISTTYYLNLPHRPTPKFLKRPEMVRPQVKIEHLSVALKKLETATSSVQIQKKQLPPSFAEIPASSLSAAQSTTPSPSPTSSPTPTLTPTPSPSSVPSEEDSPISSPTPTPSVTPSPSPTPTATPTLVPSPTPLSEPIFSPAPTFSPSPTPTSSESPTPSPSPTAQPTMQPSPQPAPSPVVSPTHSWSIKSVSSMKETKDKVCNPRSLESINKWVSKAKELGVNYIAVETPYDNPGCASSLEYTQNWIFAIRAHGLKVWHRHMPLAFEGIYNVPKAINVDYLPMISDYIKSHPDFFEEGDIFTPIPEPQNSGIKGITYCPSGLCYFNGKAEFNTWLRNAIDSSNSAFSSIGLGGKIKVGYFGFDGFIVWGDNNPDWHGILEDSTVAKMGNLTIDHYPEAIGDTMENDLKELSQKYPNIPIIIGEWGTISGGDTEQTVKNSMGAAFNHPQVQGFNYWHFGMGGHESLINEDFSEKAQFDEVQSFFKR